MVRNLADCHVHIRGGNFEKIQKLLDDIHSEGVTEAALQALPYHSISENISALYWKANYQKINLTAFGGIHLTDQYTDIPYEKQAERLLALGCDGIKLIDMHPIILEYTRKYTSHPDYDPMLSMLEERGIPLLLHANDPRECWAASKEGMPEGLAVFQGAYLGKRIPDYEEIYGETLRMLDKHPRLRIVLAHFFFLSSDLERAKLVMEKYPTVMLDLTPAQDMYFHFMKQPQQWHDFFVKYQDRILFGTDTNARKDFNKELECLVREFVTHDYTTFRMPCYGKHEICGLNLPEKVIQKICYTNYMQWVGNARKPVDIDGIYTVAEIVLREIRQTPNPYYENAKELMSRPDEEWSPKQMTAQTFFQRMLEKRL